MHFHLTRREVQTEIVERFGFTLDQANAILDYLEEGGQIEFSGALFIVKHPTSQDALNIAGVAHAALGRGSGGAVSHYKIKEYLDLMLRFASTRPRKRGVTS